MSHELFMRHRETLERAIAAVRTREFFAVFPESPSRKVYGEEAPAAGQQAFEARLGRPFELDQPTTGAWVGAEESPWGIELGIRYPAPDVDRMIAAARAALPAWRDVGPEVRAGVCLEILTRLNARSFEMAYAVMHTTGQGFAMAFQAGGPHAQDRGVEAVAYALDLQRRVPARTVWARATGRDRVERFEKEYRIVPHGLGLVVGCSTFPTWNGYPSLFADLATGNPVLIKPHPRVVLPLALTVEVARAVLQEAGFDPALVQLVVDTPEAPLTRELAQRPEIRLIDFTGSTAFGDWLERHAPQARVFTEKAGVNCVILHSTDNYRGMLANLAFSLSLYSGQMCTTPQDIFIPAGGIATDQGPKSFDEIASDLAAAIDRLLADPARAGEILGCIQNPATLERIERVQQAAGADVVRPSSALEHPKFPKARIRTPLLVRATSGQLDLYGEELFGPIAFLIEADDVDDAIARVGQLLATRGALTLLAHSTDAGVMARIEQLALERGVALSENLTGGVYVNQSAAFSDYHATGVNPAANATLVDEDFVASRYHIVQRRRPVREAGGAGS